MIIWCGYGFSAWGDVKKSQEDALAAFTRLKTTL